MDHPEHVALIRGGVLDENGAPIGRVWADLGSGGGAFTLALADLLGGQGTIYSIDQNRGALREQENAMRTRFPGVTVHYQVANFSGPLDLPALDGIIMANSLHYIPHAHQEGLLKRLQSYLRPGGRLIGVEYDVDQGNFAVPYPLSYPSWEGLAARAGYVQTTLLATRPSRFLRGFYAALSFAPSVG